MALETIRVLVVDDHPVVRDGVAAALHGRAGIAVVGSAGSRVEALEVVDGLRPNVVLVDLHMPGGNGIGLIREFARVYSAARCLVFTMDEDDESLFGAIQAGACGYVLKGARGDELELAIRAASAGEMVFGSQIAGRVKKLFDEVVPVRGAGTFPQLTERDLRLLSLLAQGLDNPAIGRRLGLAPKTVRNQVSLLLTKMGVADRAAAVAAARDAGLGRSGPNL